MAQATSSNALKNRCPHCGKVAEVAAHLVGETIPCPNPDCGQVFRVSVPPGEPVDDDEPVEAGGALSGKQAADIAPVADETRLFVIHPAFVRQRPLYSLLAMLAGLSGLALLICGAGGRWDVFEPRAGLLAPGVLLIVGGTLAGGAMLVFAWWWLLSLFTTLTVTNKRCTYREGIVARDTSEVQHDDVRNLQIDQSVVQRLLGIGDIAISSSGQDDMEIVAAAIPAPDRVAKAIRENQ